jgi:phosphate-selective porin
LVKYDWYDPNTKVSGKSIGAPGANLSSANIKYNTLGIGYINYLTENVKLVLFYSMPKNEQTALAGYTNDLKDNVLTCRLQFRF